MNDWTGRIAKSATAIDLLPPADTKRWTAHRKAAVVDAVNSGGITIEQVCRRYDLFAEEFLAWQRALETYGVKGLRTTQLKIYRGTPPTKK